MVDLNRGEYFTGAWVISYLSCTVYEREMQPFPISRSSVYHLQYFIYLILLHAPCKITFGFILSLCCFFWYSLKYVQLLHLAMYQPDTLLCLWRKQGQKKSFFLRYLLTKSRSFLPRQSNSCVSSPFSGRQLSAKGMARAWGSSTLIFWSLVGVSLTWLLITVKARNSVQHYSSECGWRLMRSMRCTLLWDACWHIRAPGLSHRWYFQRPSLPQIFSSGHALVHHHLRIPHWSNSVSLLEEYFLKHVTSGMYALKTF